MIQQTMDFDAPTTQAEELARVNAAIGNAILEFKQHVGVAGEFHCADLRAFVVERFPSIAPDSPSRILRHLRQQGVLDYRVINRRASLYEFTA